jgi:glycosyltransferase involved in cell wall biosynthesis
MKIAIVAEHASAAFGGEALLPLNYFRLLRKRNYDVRLLVHCRSRAELIQILGPEIDRVTFVEDHVLQKLLFHAGKLLPAKIAEATTGYLSHLITQLEQRKLLRDMVHRNEIELVHEPIPVSPKMPSLMFGIGVPVIIGPMNGGMEYPPAFRRTQGFVTRAAVRCMRKLSHVVNGWLRGKKDARILLVANDRTRQALPVGVKGEIFELVENGVDLSVWQVPEQTASTPRGATRFVFLGRLVDWKAVDLLLEAFAKMPAQIRSTLEIIGDGPMRAEWGHLAARLSLSDRVIFSGWLSQTESAAHLRNSDVLVLPSLFECGGAVVLEAMAVGLPVIATDWGGPSDYLDPSCGVLVAPASRQALVEGLLAGMVRLAESPGLCAAMGRAAREKVRGQFDWNAKIDRMLAYYERALQSAAVTTVQAAGR